MSIYRWDKIFLRMCIMGVEKWFQWSAHVHSVLTCTYIYTVVAKVFYTIASM